MGDERGILRAALLKLVGVVLFLSIVLSLVAGTLKWLMGWVYITLVALGSFVATFWAERDLLRERLDPPQEGVSSWDLVMARLVALVLPALCLIVAGLDYRWDWSGRMTAWLRLLGVVGLVAAEGLLPWSMIANRFFSPLVRIQSERGHQVVRGGPYAVVRHPGHLASLLHALVLPLVLGSWWTYLPAVVLAAATLLRTAWEDRDLRRNLDGYAAYMKEVRWRLLPYVW